MTLIAARQNDPPILPSIQFFWSLRLYVVKTSKLVNKEYIVPECQILKIKNVPCPILSRFKGIGVDVFSLIAVETGTEGRETATLSF